MKNSYNYIVALIIILLIGAFLRIYKLNQRPLYGDELMSLKWSSMSFSQYMSTGALKGDEKPLYYIFLRFWRVFILDNVISMRMISVVAGILSILMLFFFAKRIVGVNVAILSSFFMAISPFHVYYSQEIRMYVLEALFVLISFYLFTNIFHKERVSKLLLVAYVLSSSVAIHFHITAFLGLIVQNIYFFIKRKDCALSVGGWLMSQVLIAVLTPQVLIPVLFIFGFKFGNWANYIPVVTQSVYVKFPYLDLPKTYFIFTCGFVVRQFRENAALVIAVSLVSFPLFALGFSQAMKSIKREKHFLLVLLLSIVPVLFLFSLFNFLGNAYEYRSRYVMISSFAYYILLAQGASCINSKTTRVAFITALVLLMFYSLYRYYAFNNLST